MESSDIYGDLNSVDLGEKINKLQAKNRELLALLIKRTQDIGKLCAELTLMKKTELSLKTNISELYKSSKLEIERKDRQIAELRSQCEALVFRRRCRVDIATENNVELDQSAVDTQDKPQRSTSRIETVILTERAYDSSKDESKSPPPRAIRSKRNRSRSCSTSPHKNVCTDTTKKKRSRSCSKSTYKRVPIQNRLGKRKRLPSLVKTSRTDELKYNTSRSRSNSSNYKSCEDRSETGSGSRSRSPHFDKHNNKHNEQVTDEEVLNRRLFDESEKGPNSYYRSRSSDNCNRLNNRTMYSRIRSRIVKLENGLKSEDVQHPPEKNVVNKESSGLRDTKARSSSTENRLSECSDVVENKKLSNNEKQVLTNYNKVQKPRLSSGIDDENYYNGLQAEIKTSNPINVISTITICNNRIKDAVVTARQRRRCVIQFN